MIGGNTPPVLTPAYPWGQGDPQRMSDPDIDQGAFEKPPTTEGGGIVGFAVAAVVVTLMYLTLRKVKR